MWAHRSCTTPGFGALPAAAFGLAFEAACAFRLLGESTSDGFNLPFAGAAAGAPGRANDACFLAFDGSAGFSAAVVAAAAGFGRGTAVDSAAPLPLSCASVRPL